MPSTTKKPSRLGKDSSMVRPALPPAVNSGSSREFKLRLQLVLSTLAVAACLFLLIYTSDVMMSELSKALTIVVCMNTFRIITNNNTSTEN